MNEIIETTDDENSDFTYDLEAMKKALNSPSSIFPRIALESDEKFDEFLNACLDTESKPSQEILEAAKLLDTEGI